ncbi:MAG: hypothetical protein WC304_04750 [Candidatus Gracilibacteria bacterium]|jgi:hypothetical protein
MTSKKKYEEAAKLLLQKIGNFVAKIFPTTWKILKEIGRGFLNLLLAIAKIIQAFALTLLIVIIGIFLAVTSFYFLAQAVGLPDSPAFQQFRERVLENHLPDFSTGFQEETVEIK